MSDIKSMLSNDEDKKRRTRRNIGLALLGVGIGGPLALQGRQLLKVRKALKLMKADALKSTADVDKYISRHLAATGKKIPKYRWSNLADVKKSNSLGAGAINSEADVIRENARIRANNERWSKGPIRFAPEPELPLPSSKTLPVYTNIDDLMKGIDHTSKDAPVKKFFGKLLRRISGPHFDPESGYVYLGGRLSPKALLHELGHAQDAINGKLLAEDRKLKFGLLKGRWKALRDPDSTGLLQQEIRAWDNGGIAAGDKVREAALDTYRSGVRAQAVAPAFQLFQIPGAYMAYTNRDKSKKK